MRGFMRSRCIATSFVLILCATVTTAYAQLAQFGPAVTTLAPAAGIPVDLKLDVLTVIPDDALGFLTAHHLKGLRTTVENVLRKLSVPFEAGGDYADFNEFIDSVKGWNDEAAHAVAFFENPDDDDPLAAGFVPVKNYPEFLKSIGTAEGSGEGPVEFKNPDHGDIKGWVALKNGYAIITEPSDDGKALLTVILASKKSVSSSCEPIRKWLGEQQAAAVATTAGVQHAVDLMLKELENAENDVPDDAIGKQLAPVLMKLAKQGLQLARSELTHVAFAPNIDEAKGLRFQVRAVYPAGGQVAAFVKGIPPLPADSLKHLSGEDYFAVQSYTNLEALTKPSLAFVSEMLALVAKSNELPFDAAEWKGLLDEGAEMWKGVHHQSAVTAFIPGAGLYDGMCGLIRIDDAKAYLVKQEAWMKRAWAAARKLSPKIPEYPLEVRKVDGRDVNAYSFNVIELMALMSPNDPAVAQSQAMMKQMIGNGGKVTVLFSAVDDNHIVYAFSDDMLTTIADNIRDGKAGLADNVLIQQTAALLPRDLAAVGYVDIGGYVEMVKQMMTQMMAGQGAGGFALPIPPFPNAPPFGYSLKSDAAALQADLVIPMDLMTAVRDYVMQVMAVFGGGGLNLN